MSLRIGRWISIAEFGLHTFLELTGAAYPAEWREISNHVVFAFNDPNNWDVDSVDFTVGGADPQDFYQTDAWAGFDPSNDQGRSREEMSESYRESCEREIRNLIGNAVPKNFSIINGSLLDSDCQYVALQCSSDCRRLRRRPQEDLRQLRRHERDARRLSSASF